jgi:hypothetical protein
LRCDTYGVRVTGRLETGLSPVAGRLLPSWYEQYNDPQALPERPDRLPVGQHRAPLPAGRWPDRAAPHLRPPRDRRRPLLPGQGRLLLADAAARLPALEDRFVLLLHLAGRGRLGARPCGAPPGDPRGRRPGADAERLHHRQPVGEDDRGGRPEGVRRGKKRCRAASGTCSSTPSG